MPVSTSAKPSVELERIRGLVGKKQKAGVREIRVCCGTGCQARGSVALYRALREEAKSFADAEVRVKKTGCQGLCEAPRFRPCQVAPSHNPDQGGHHTWHAPI